MSHFPLLDELRKRDIHLVVKRGVLTINAPDGVLTDEIRARVREHKAELLTLIAASPTLAVDPDVPAVVRCNWPGCHEPVRLVRLHDGSEEQWCGSSHPQHLEPVTALEEPTRLLPLAPAGDEGERRVADYLQRGKPLLPCPICRRDSWEEAEAGTWRCHRCGTGERERSEARAELLIWAEAHAWPRLPLAHGTAIPGGEGSWRGTVRDVSPRSLAAIAAAVLRETPSNLDGVSQRLDKAEDGRYPLAAAMVLADQLLARLAPACERIAITGSIRRRKATGAPDGQG